MDKVNPYLNVDPGTIGPTQHGEVFVTDDGAEADLDLGTTKDLLGCPQNLIMLQQVKFTPKLSLKKEKVST